MQISQFTQENNLSYKKQIETKDKRFQTFGYAKNKS